MVQIRKVLGSLGLAMKAGDVVSGEFMTEKAIREGIARLVIVAKDASGNTTMVTGGSTTIAFLPCSLCGVWGQRNAWQGNRKGIPGVCSSDK